MNPSLEPQDSPKQPVKRKKRKHWLRRLLLGGVSFLLLVLVLVIAARFYIKGELSPVSTVRQAGQFEVLPGWGGKRVATELERSGLIRNARIFSYYLRFNNLDTQIGEGLYDLDPSMSSAEIAANLAKGGRPRTVRMIIPEGFRLQDVENRLNDTGIADAGTWNALLHYPDHQLFSLIPEGKTFEGFLFPASYDIPVKSAAFDVLKLMYGRFEQELNDDIKAQLEALNLSVYDWVTLASIVQSEAANFEEMPVIAGVFLNRLDLGMALQSDPTVAYGLGKDLPELNAPAGDFEVDHPWNTYTRAGLPESPISNPGSEALEAILNPVRQTADGQDYLYFLHGFDGDQKVFRPNTNLADHNRDVSRYLR
ncbi:MAG: endolytic transglycosylase MltG [Trueperaceae bacterium]|nr:endolytic transglycosylase MltG [Trueperaceae bacterium]